MHPLAHHAGEQALAPLLLLTGSGLSLVTAVSRERLAVYRSVHGWPGTGATEQAEAMRAREPDTEGYIDLDGVKLNWEDFVAFFFAECFPEPHSTKQVEDCVGWALDTEMWFMGPRTPRSSSRWARIWPTRSAAGSSWWRGPAMRSMPATRSR